MIWALLMAAVTWPFMTAIDILLYMTGLILVPLAVLTGAYDEQYTFFGYFRPLFTWPLMAPWQNFEDGIFGPPSYLTYNSSFERALKWTCFRNPVSGLRWLPPLSTLINPSKICYAGNLGPVEPEIYELKQPSFVYVWQGVYSCVWWHFTFHGTLYRLFVGHKLYAADCKPQDYGYRKYGTGFGMQFKAVPLGANKN